MVQLNVSAKSNLYKLETKPDFCSAAENLKQTLEQMRNQVQNFYVKLDSLRGSLQDEGQ